MFSSFDSHFQRQPELAWWQTELTIDMVVVVVNHEVVPKHL